MNTLEELFDTACQYGNVYLHQSERDRTFSCNIQFMTADRVTLTATSGFKHPTVASAVSAAIKEAEGIVDAVKNTPAFAGRSHGLIVSPEKKGGAA